MLVLLADLLTLGIAIALSPLAIVAVILIATAGRGRTSGTAFVLGNFAFAAVFVAILVSIGRSAGAEDGEPGPRITIGIIETTLGIGMLVLALLEWRKRSRHATPKWMDSLDHLNLRDSFVLGVLIAGPLSPKDLPLLVSASGRISQADLPVSQVVAVILIFSVLGIIAILVPWCMSVVSPNSVEQRLSGLRTWLVANHSVIMVVLFIVLGFKLLGSGIADVVR